MEANNRMINKFNVTDLDSVQYFNIQYTIF